jgi:hypothetical protein
MVNEIKEVYALVDFLSIDSHLLTQLALHVANVDVFSPYVGFVIASSLTSPVAALLGLVCFWRLKHVLLAHGVYF